MRILIVEDEITTLDGLRTLVEMMGHEVITATTVATGLAALQGQTLDLVILDMMLPDGSGVEILRSMRGSIAVRNVPVLMLTSVGGIDAKIETFDLGVEDYVVKPFEARELMARMNVILRRSGPKTIAGDGQTTYDEVDKVLSAGELSVALTLNEDRLFRALFSRPNEAVPKPELYQQIWGERRVGVRNLDTLVNYLRKKIEPTGLEIKSVYGVGYMLAADEKGTPR